MEGNQHMASFEPIGLEDIRRYYFKYTKSTLRIEDARYLQERSMELGLNMHNGGVKALFSTLNYKFEKAG
jgi:hypothetical protein